MEKPQSNASFVNAVAKIPRTRTFTHKNKKQG